MKKYLFLLVFGLLGLATDMQGQPLLKTHVETGDVEGVIDESLAVYKAIPYAAPPVGNLRWKAPQPALPWEGVRVCDTFGPLPPQPTRQGRTADMMSEDCLSGHRHASNFNLRPFACDGMDSRWRIPDGMVW